LALTLDFGKMEKIYKYKILGRTPTTAISPESIARRIVNPNRAVVFVKTKMIRAVGYNQYLLGRG